MNNEILIDPTWQELLEWDHAWDTIRLCVSPDFVIFASGYGYTHADIIREIKGDAKRCRLDLICAIAYWRNGRMRFCIDDESECSETALRTLKRHNPRVAQVMRDVAQLREARNFRE